MPSVEKIKYDVLPKAETFLRETYRLDDDYEVESFKVSEKEVAVGLSGATGIELTAKIPLALLYPPGVHPDQTELELEHQDARTPAERVRDISAHIAGVDASGVVVTPADLGVVGAGTPPEPPAVRDCTTCTFRRSALKAGCHHKAMDDSAVCDEESGYPLYGAVPVPEPEMLERCCDNCRHDGTTDMAMDGENLPAFCCYAEIPEGELCNIDNDYKYFEPIMIPEPGDLHEFGEEEENDGQSVRGLDSGAEQNPSGDPGVDDEHGDGEGESLGDGPDGVRQG